MEWQPIETAPKDGTGIITYPHYRVTFWTNECLTASGEGWAGGWDDYAEGFAHIEPRFWMPLPEPPKGDFVMEWQPIETAPKDGTVILTDDGTAMFDSAGRWVACGTSGYPYSCVDNGVYDLEPTVWMPLP